MITALLGIKRIQTQRFTESGKRIPTTTIIAGPCWVTQVIDTPAYKGIQLGFGTMKHLTKAEEGHIKKAGLTQKLRFLRSFRSASVEGVTVGMQVVNTDVLSVGDHVTVTGISKGKGFAGVVKRHGFAGGPRTHGQSDKERAPGSIGQTTTPGRVYRGKRMAGRMGNDTISLKHLVVVDVDKDHHLVTVKGLIPGAVGGLLRITKE